MFFNSNFQMDTANIIKTGAEVDLKNFTWVGKGMV